MALFSRAFVLCLLAVSLSASAETRWQSHPPLRSLPTGKDRPLADGTHLFVDPRQGDDKNTGAKDSPWRTIQHGIAQLKPGHTLVLRGGTYYEHVTIKNAGAPDAPITLRAHPGEVAIIDAGYAEFVNDPASAWEPFTDGGEGEYRSVKTYDTDEAGGNFGDSMVPLRLYGSFVDLRAKGEYEDKSKKTSEGVYVGPGIRIDETTKRIHVRLAHTNQTWLGDENYRGETDPRKIPLVVAGNKSAITLENAKHIRLQDIVLRGASTAAKVFNCEQLELDGVTIYSMKFGMVISGCKGFKAVHCAFRGFDAPWHPRASGTDVDCFCPLDLVTAARGSDFEFAYNEFTDHHDCIQLGDVDTVKFHHNLVDHMNDDGIDIDLGKELGRFEIYQNRISRCLTPLSIHSAVEASPGEAKGMFVYRNVFDQRRGTYSSPPASADDPNTERAVNRVNYLASDHGNPTWPPIYFYHNTVLQRYPSNRAYYGNGVGYNGAKVTRRVFNNVFVSHQLLDPKRKGGFTLPAKIDTVDLHTDGNLFWGLEDGTTQSESPLARFQKSKAFEESKTKYAPGWAAKDVFADPMLIALTADAAKNTDLRPQAKSPVINAGVSIPSEWPDSLRQADKDAPDIGAFPTGSEPERIGINGSTPICP